MRVGAVQLTSTADKDKNLATAGRLIGDAVVEGAELVVLPEMFNCLGTGAELRAGAEPLDGPTALWLADQAVEHDITLVGGTFVERDEPRNHNTCCVFGPDGERLAAYRKIHLFDVEVPGAEFHESDAVGPGDEIVVVDVDEIRLGLSVCYDVRFPELYRIATLQGATVVTVPAAFTAKTGPPHWEILLRARAIENQVFVIAAGQRGSTNDKLHWHGHSMIIDPWGTILAENADTEGVIVADLDLDAQTHVRDVLPSLANRRPAAYRWPD